MIFRWAATSAIRLYRYLISPLLGSAKCRFYPTCSEYALQAYTDCNVLEATYLSFRRIIRCQPFGAHGYDPLPASKREES